MTTSPTAPSSGASKLFLVVAVALGVLATILAFATINSAGGGDNGPGIRIVLAKHDLSPNMTIDPDRDLKEDTVPRKYAAMAQGSLDWEARSTYKGQRVNRDIKAMQPVLAADFAAVGSLVLEKPYFALSLPADTGMIIPGDYVRLIFSRGIAVDAGTATLPGAAGQPRFDAMIIGPAEGIKVLAVGGYLFKTRGQVTVADQYSASTANLKSVTLMVTESQAKEIVGALAANSTQRVTMLICPSPLTEGPKSGETDSEPATKPVNATKP